MNQHDQNDNQEVDNDSHDPSGRVGNISDIASEIAELVKVLLPTSNSASTYAQANTFLQKRLENLTDVSNLRIELSGLITGAETSTFIRLLGENENEIDAISFLRDECQFRFNDDLLTSILTLRTQNESIRVQELERTPSYAAPLFSIANQLQELLPDLYVRVALRRDNRSTTPSLQLGLQLQKVDSPKLAPTKNESEILGIVYEGLRIPKIAFCSLFAAATQYRTHVIEQQGNHNEQVVYGTTFVGLLVAFGLLLLFFLPNYALKTPAWAIPGAVLFWSNVVSVIYESGRTSRRRKEAERSYNPMNRSGGSAASK